MKTLFKTSLFSIALIAAPLSAHAGMCGSHNKYNKHGYNKAYPMMQPGYYNPAYRMMPQPMMPPQPYVMMPMQPAYAMMPMQMPMMQPQAAPAQAKPAAPVQPAAAAAQVDATPKAQVAINGMQFQPAKLTIKAGESVTWTNNSAMPHTVTSTDGKTMASGQLGNGGTFEHVFKEPGTYSYYCAVHPSMKGEIVVE